MSLRRQGSHYLAVGGLQWLLDWGVTVWLSHMGLAIEAANISGRVSGALLGYWLNGKLTFAGDGVTDCQISKPDGWPTGKYKVEIMLDGNVVQTREFEVR